MSPSIVFLGSSFHAALMASSKVESSFSVVFSQEKHFDLDRLFSCIWDLRLEAESTRFTVFCHCWMLGSSRKPASPTTSGTPPLLQAIMGFPHAIASRTTKPKVSIVLGNKKAEHLCMSRTTSESEGDSIILTLSATPIFSAMRISFSLYHENSP